jgi:hypothetical protein
MIAPLRVAEHVLEELLADEHRAHERPEDDQSRAGSNPEESPPCDVEVVEGIPRTPLPDEECDQAGHGDGR